VQEKDFNSKDFKIKFCNQSHRFPALELSMKPSEIQFAQNLHALSVPQCRRMVEVLIQDSHTLKDLSKLCKLTPASIDKHLEILIDAGLVKVRTVGGVKKAHLQTSKFKPTLDWFQNLSN
jgi:DNA-binding transcriptional ArsR family regulator